MNSSCRTCIQAWCCVSGRVLWCVAVWCSELQCVALYRRMSWLGLQKSVITNSHDILRWRMCNMTHLSTRVTWLIYLQKSVITNKWVMLHVDKCLALCPRTCAAVWCSVLQCVAACCSLLQCVAVYCILLQLSLVRSHVTNERVMSHVDKCFALCPRTCALVCAAACGSVLCCVAVCCGVLQRVAVYCISLQLSLS